MPIIKNKSVLSEMQSKLEELIENDKLRKQLGNNGYKKVESGKFSLDYRNKTLKEVYEKAIE